MEDDEAADWKAFNGALQSRRDQLRDEINRDERALYQISAKPSPTLEDQGKVADLRRQLDWKYAEVGYARKDADVSAPTARPNTTLSPAAIIAENDALFETVKILPERLASVQAAADKILSGRARYETVAKVEGIPWWLIGIINQLESNGSFERHLNGDPLNARTVNTAIGLPKEGTPPFTWEQSAAELIWPMPVFDGSVGSALYEPERFHGLGYRRKGTPSPYVWGCTDRIAEYSPGVCGGAPLLRVLIDKGAVSF